MYSFNVQVKSADGMKRVCRKGSAALFSRHTESVGAACSCHDRVVPPRRLQRDTPLGSQRNKKHESACR